MASAFRRGKKIYIKFRGVAGKWQMRPTAHTKLLEARNFAAELEARFQRSRDGLEPAPRDPTRTFGWLYEWWWKEYGSKRRAKSNVEAHRICQARVLPHLGELPLTQVTQGAIEAMLAANEGPWETPEGLERAKVGEESINKLRAVVHLVISRASDRDMWPGANPAKLVRRRKPGRQAFETLRADEVGPLLHALEEKDRPLFATAMWQAMRKGELLGLRKSDVDLHELTITIRRSWDQDRPKSGDAEVIPIAEPVVPYLREAMANSPSELVFPGSNGQMQHVKTRLEYKLRWALARAGITHGWLHTCRRCKTRGTPYEQRHDDEQLRHCPQCNMKLWPKALLRKIRFHDLRATTATLLARAGVSVQIAQKILRHSDPKLTANIYSRVEMSDMRTALNSIRPEGLPDAPQAREAVAVGAEGLPGLGADVVRWSEPASGETVGPSAQLNNPGVLLNRGERIRTSDLSVPNRQPHTFLRALPGYPYRFCWASRAW